MIILSDKAPAIERVFLDRGDEAKKIGPAWIEVRPCTTLESNTARERARPLIAGLLLGRRSEDEIAAILGPEFGEKRGTDDVAFAAAASERLALIEIVAICASAWQGFGDHDGKPLELNRVNIARVLRVPAYADRLSASVNRPLFERRVEGNAFAASPSGAAAAGNNGVLDAAKAESPVPGVAAIATTAPSVPSTSTSQ